MAAAFRSVAIGATAIACLVTIPLTGDHVPAVTAALTWVLVVLQGRSRLTWVLRLPFGRTVRRVMRVAVFLLPWPWLGLPFAKVAPLPLLAGVLIGALSLGSQWREVRSGLSRRYIALLPGISPADRSRDLFLYLSAGAAQEFLYRGVLLAAIDALAGPVPAIAITAGMFVAEHALQFDAASSWDRRDYVTQGVLGVVFGASVLATGCLAVAVAAHTLYNVPQVMQTVLRPSSRPRRAAQPMPSEEPKSAQS